MRDFITILLFAIGAFLLINGYTMDTSVEVEYSNGNEFGLPDRVNNLGLMREKQNYYMFGAVLLIGSFILMGTSPKKENKVVNNYNKNNSISDEILKLRNLLHEGAITQEEFDSQKSKILNT